MSKQTPRKRAKQTTINEALGLAATPKRPRLDIDDELNDNENTPPAPRTNRFPAASWHQEDASELVDKNKMAIKLADEMRKELAYQALNGPHDHKTEHTITTRTIVEIAISNDSTMSEHDTEATTPIEKHPFTFHDNLTKPILSSTQVFDLEDNSSITRSEADLVCTNQPSQIIDQTQHITKKILLDSTNISMNPLTGAQSYTNETTSLDQQSTPSIQGSIKQYINQLVANEVKKGLNMATNTPQPIDPNRNVNRLYHAIENREEALDYFRKTAKHNRTFRSALPFIKDPELHRTLFQEGLITASDLHANNPEIDDNMDSDHFSIEEPLGLKVTCGVHGDTSKESRIIQAFPEGTCGLPNDDQNRQFDVH